jgi:hypothetical protein
MLGEGSGDAKTDSRGAAKDEHVLVGKIERERHVCLPAVNNSTRCNYCSPIQPRLISVLLIPQEMLR